MCAKLKQTPRVPASSVHMHPFFPLNFWGTLPSTDIFYFEANGFEKSNCCALFVGGSHCSSKRGDEWDSSTLVEGRRA